MGGILTKWWWGGDPDQENPLSGLTLRDVYAIEKSWTPLYAEAEKYGMELFIRLFRMDPSIRTFFKIIRADADEGQITRNNNFKAHVINFMSSINMAVHSLNHPTVVMAMMEKLGRSHTRLHVDRKHFDTVKAVLVDFLKNDLKLDKSTLESWQKFVAFIYKHIFLQLKTKQSSAIF